MVKLRKDEQQRGMEIEREREGEGRENRGLMSPLLYFTVAPLPAGDTQETAPNCM